MKASCSCALLAASLGFEVTTEAFLSPSSATIRCRPQRWRYTREVAAEPEAAGMGNKWSGNSWPAESEKRKTVPSNTKDWEMENTHVEVWEDRPNPVEDLAWWENYAPSEEEVDAAAQGFNWTEGWFEAAGITPEEPPTAKSASEEK